MVGRNEEVVAKEKRREEKRRIFGVEC